MMKKLLVVLGLMLFFAGSAFAWSTPRWTVFPLNVYREDDENSAPVQQAFLDWQTGAKKVNPFIRFDIKDGPRGLRKSQIDVRFVSGAQPNGQYYTISSNSLTDGFSLIRNTTGFFYHVSITISKADSSGKPLSRSKIHSIALQAVGRSLGVNCIGAPNAAMSCNTTYDINSVTLQDLNALKNVYSYVRNHN